MINKGINKKKINTLLKYKYSNIVNNETFIVKVARTKFTIAI